MRNSPSLRGFTAARFMAIDPSKFHTINVADTCAVWNLLSSATLHAAANAARCDFCITSFVHYECLIKPRKNTPTTAERELITRLQREQSAGRFARHSCDIGDLQAVRLLESRKRLGKGELSSIAFAMKIGQAVITDDQKARKLAIDSGHKLTQTTPHLLSWLIFTGRLGDGDKDRVIAQQKTMDRPLALHFEEAYRMALSCRLNATAR
jgi:hypothetical protein